MTGKADQAQETPLLPDFHIPAQYELDISVFFGGQGLRLSMMKFTFLPFLPPAGLEMQFAELAVCQHEERDDEAHVHSVRPTAVSHIAWRADETADPGDLWASSLMIDLADSCIHLPDADAAKQFFAAVDQSDWIVTRCTCRPEDMKAAPWLAQWARTADNKHLLHLETGLYQLDQEVQKLKGKRLNREDESLGSELKTRDARVKQVGQEIQEQLQTKASLQIAMSEVLSRVKVLRQQQDKFDELRDEINVHLQKMDDYYMRARRQSPGVLPP